MKISTHAVLQTILTLIQGVNLAQLTSQLNWLPPKWSAGIMFAVSALQAVLGLYNHYFTPSGSYVPR